ncbi:hypothetical protein [Cyclobacterium roseum]|uniref:hypothetical protein n=1 Tax=Cyclobacterium roseum TaxID=2666137 RepID=UPI001390B8D8|nr:hypothetical protein [Cyclobacterium roseum]
MNKESIGNSHFLLILLALVGFCAGGCLEKEAGEVCLQGRYTGAYCEGMVVEILGESDIAMNWEGMFNSEAYTHSVVASVDTLFLSQLPDRTELEEYILAGNSFYFQYRIGGYPRKQYSICEPSPFITISTISKTRCHDYSEN